MKLKFAGFMVIAAVVAAVSCSTEPLPKPKTIAPLQRYLSATINGNDFTTLIVNDSLNGDYVSFLAVKDKKWVRFKFRENLKPDIYQFPNDSLKLDGVYYDPELKKEWLIDFGSVTIANIDTVNHTAQGKIDFTVKKNGMVPKVHITGDFRSKYDDDK